MLSAIIDENGNVVSEIKKYSTPKDAEDIVALSKSYNKPELRNYYCCNYCEIGAEDAPEVEIDSGVHEILVNMAISLKTLNHNKIRLMEILGDGEVSDDEKEEFYKISDELENISSTVESLQLWCEKMKIKMK